MMTAAFAFFFITIDLKFDQKVMDLFSVSE